ncbi:hypothetical protein MSAN_00218500 [Mycena sanguinolenta]|uniref:Uncharacterized protein n=1 Tax=Mycena sanguinolenta TaxID=230812 RepID=A0A8H6ZKA1_9AGAR|nr:hypothetical protein MSAN_00218500 [Mycena sanguinolenta]
MSVANYNSCPIGNNNLRTTTTISFEARKAIKDDVVGAAPPHSSFHILTAFAQASALESRPSTETQLAPTKLSTCGSKPDLHLIFSTMTAVLSAADNYGAYAQAKADGCFPTVKLECAAWDKYFPTFELKIEALEHEFPAEFPDVWEPIATTIIPLSESPIATVSPVVIRSTVKDGTPNNTDTAAAKPSSSVAAYKDSPVPAALSLGSGQYEPIVRSTRLPAPATRCSGVSGEPITRSTAPARQEPAGKSSSSSSSSSSPSFPSVIRPTKADTGMKNVDQSTELTISSSFVSPPQTTSSNPIQRFQSVMITAPFATENPQLVNEDIEMSRSCPPGASTTSSSFTPIQHPESVVMTSAATNKSGLVNEDIEMSCSPPSQETSSSVWGTATYKGPPMSDLPSAWKSGNQPSYNIFSFASSHGNPPSQAPAFPTALQGFVPEPATIYQTPSALNPPPPSLSPPPTPLSIFELMQNEPPSPAAHRRPNAYVIPPVAIPQHLWQQEVIREQLGRNSEKNKPKRSRLSAPYFLRTPLTVAHPAKKASRAFSSRLHNDDKVELSPQNEHKPPEMPSRAPAPSPAFSAPTTWMYCNGHKLSSPPPFKERFQRFTEPAGGLFGTLTTMFWSYLISAEIVSE